MAKIENRVRVLDTAGEVHEMTQRNATDVIQNLGWKLEGAIDAEAQLALAPRTKNQRAAKLAANASEQEVMLKAVKQATPTVKKTVKKSKPVDVELPFDEQAAEDVTDDLEALEAEEEKRGER